MAIKGHFYHLFIIIFLLVFQNHSVTADNKIDSLKIAIDNEHDIINKSQLYLSLSIEYKTTDLPKSEKVAKQALLLVENIENEEVIGLIHAHLGDVAFLQDSLGKAEKEYYLAIPLLEEAGNFKRLIRVYLSLGNRFVEKGNYPEAMNYYLKALNIAQLIDDADYLPNIYNNLGVVYINLNDHNKALEYYTKALPLFEAANDTMNVAGATTNIGSIYIQLGEEDIARQYYKRGYEIFKNMGLIAGQAHSLFKLGLLDLEQKNYPKALENLFESKRLQESFANNVPGSKSMFLAETDINIGIVYFLLNRTFEAEEYLKSGLAASREGDQVGLIALASEYLSKVYKQKKNYEKSLEYYTMYNVYSDSLFNEENVRRLTQLELQNQFDAEIKEVEIERLAEEQKRKRLIFIYVVTIVGLLLILVIVGLMLKLEKNKKKEVELEREILTEKLEHTNKELTTYVMYLLKKNEFILTIIEKLKRARIDAKPENKRVMAELIAELKSNTDTVSWDEFEVRFQQVHTEFYTKLSKQFPDLTTNEIRLCAFFKLNMTSKEIAAITYQSLNSIKVARYRLRKKLKIEKEENLVSFLAQF